MAAIDAFALRQPKRMQQSTHITPLLWKAYAMLGQVHLTVLAATQSSRMAAALVFISKPQPF